ncbi:MAG: gliding motility-associated C-terminal domain-containing protein [Fluviicola sp.]|nr:gliding motility-associated C-terminal domain-containing protein [Fluviicola sp.]
MKQFLFLSAALLLAFGVNAQLVPNGNSGSSTTAYTNGATNDPIYIWCSDVLSTAQGSLTATPPSGVGPFTFDWYFHNQSNASWTPYTTQVGATSTVNSLVSDGYRVEIRDAGNAIVACYIAWVWNMNTEVTASNTRTGCNQANLSSVVNTTGSFSYYNPPPAESLITPSTQIQVCFSATHTWVSDLAFYLVGPPSCGSPTILLSPNPGAIGQGTVCNSGDNVNNLCFTTTPAGNLNVCAPAPSTLSGTYSSYGPANTAINWAPLIGCNAASGGWQVQIYDCISLDVGALTNSVITFSNLTSVCGSPTSITYNSGSINSAINDNSCSAGTASIFQVPPDPSLTIPINISATTTLQWTANPATAITNSTSLNATATGVPAGSTDFIQTATTVFGTANCTSDDTTTFSYALPVVNAGLDQSACSGASVTLSGSGATSYSWDNGVTNGVSFNPVATLTYTVTGTDAAGCQGTDQVVVSVGTNPIVDAGANQSICPGQSVTLNGSGANSYTWDNSVTDGVAFTPAATQTYTVTGSDVAGCQGTDQVTVTVNTLPVVGAGPDQTTCGGSVTLSGSGATSYTWDNGVTDGVSFTPASTQTYTVTGTDANGCQSTDQVTVTVGASLSVNAGQNQSICQGQSVTLTATGASGYVWDNGVTQGVSFTPASTQTYTVTVSDAVGCSATDQVTVTVNSIPNINAGANQAICPGGSVILSGSGGTTYTWNNGVTNGVSFNPASTQTYTVTGTDANGCTNTDQVLVTVNALPNVSAGQDQSVCAGTTVTLNGSGAVSYVWNLSVVNNVPFTPGATQIYTVVGTDANGCQNSDQVTVTVNPPPTIGAGADQTICVGTSVTLSGTGGVSYVWTNGVTNGVSFNPGLGTQIYTVTGTDANGCTNTDQVTITVLTVPVADINSTDPLSGYPGLAVTFTNSSTNATNFVWDYDNGDTDVTNNVNQNGGSTFNSPGTYTVTLTASNGVCDDVDQLIVIVIPFEPLVIHVPNVFTPDADGLNDTFQIDTENAESMSVIIINRWGEFIEELDEITDVWDGTSKGKEMSEGVYFFKYSIGAKDGTTTEGQGFVELIRGK